jgi:predicted SprT family Zn-dependent metalloprotease
MRILFDQGTPVAIRRFLTGHTIRTTRQEGWATLTNGSLLRVAEEAGFELLLTTDNSLAYQQNLKGRKIAIVVLSRNRWRSVQRMIQQVVAAVDATPAAREPITPAEYRAFQEAYDFFNAELFAGSLPHVLVTLQRQANAKGYFSPERFVGRTDKTAAHELAMNPDCFTGRDDEAILSTLAHEMAHVWQQTHGTPPRRSYHDREWAAKMKEIGLQPSTTGEPGGKETGQSVTDYIIPGGAYAKAKKASKTKFTCPECGQKAWAKPDALLICSECYDDGEGDICLVHTGIMKGGHAIRAVALMIAASW